MEKADRVIRVSFWIGVLLCLLQVWLPVYYPNCDGPCHVSNAAIMSDMWLHKESIYHHYYTFNYAPDPNWLTELLLVVLQKVLSLVVAEKVLLTIYIALMVFGVLRLLQQMGNRTAAWSLAFLLLIFHNAVPQGFYNFSFSVGCFLLLIASWLAFLEVRSWRRGLIYFFWLLLTYFSHPVSFVFGCFCCVALGLSHYLAGHGPADKKGWGVVSLVFGLSVSPFVILLQRFANNMGGMEEIKTKFSPDRLIDLWKLKYLVNYSHKEEDTLIAAGVVFGTLLLLVLVYRFRKVAIHRYDGFLLTLFFALIVFLVMPDAMFHGGYFVLRAGIYVLLLLCICCAYVPLPVRVLRASGVLLYGAFAALFFIRMQIEFKAADVIADHVSAGKHIRPGAVVLPLNYDTWGRDREGRVVTSCNNIFCHMAQYLTVIPKVVVLDNYEANTGYFPLNWRIELDPFRHLGRWPGLQAAPPAAAIEEYRQKTGVTVDNVLVMNFDASFRQHETAGPLIAEVERDYHVVYTSPTGRTILFERNK